MSRKSWAAADAAARGVNLASFAVRGMPGCYSALSAPDYGFQDVWFNSQAVTLQRPFSSYVMENVLFKVKYPAEFHGQTAVEAGVALHSEVANRLGEIDSIEIKTQEPAVRIIDKTGPLDNPADRDHCIQYMDGGRFVEGKRHIGRLRGSCFSRSSDRCSSREDGGHGARRLLTRVSRSDLRSIANAVQVHFDDGTSTREVEVRFPIGHRQRRSEAIPLLADKFAANLAFTYGETEFSRSVVNYSMIYRSSMKCRLSSL